MPNLNRVLLMGNLTRDPELRYTPNNTPVCSFGVAINRKWRSQDGQQNEETTFVDCEAWARTAEVINQYLGKGKPIFIEGRLRLDQWQDKDGGNRSKLKVVVESFEFIDSRGDGGGGGAGGAGGSRGGGQDNYPSSGSRNQSRGGGGSNQPSNAPMPDPHEAVGEDDIPF
jgi:single-strand DNA-binding protein